MIEHIQCIVPGATDTNEKLHVHAPYDGKLIATVATANAETVELALDTAQNLYQDQDNWLPVEKRIAILEKTASLMTDRMADLALTAATEGGKPLRDSRVEVARAIDSVKICIETLRTQAGHEIPMNLNSASMNRVAFTRKEPIGIVVAVSAFNHPLNLIVHQVAPAIAAGCPVIIKPAEDTPVSCFRFVGILHEAGLPDGWCQALTVADINVATQLVTDQRVGFFTFIGSAKVGWMLRSKLAPGVRCSLEHGGAAPVIIAEDADLQAALPLLVKGGFYHAGQVCVSVQRLFIHESIAMQFAHELAELAKRLTVGNPTLENTEVGPLIRTAELDRVDSWVKQAVTAGAKCLSGGERVGESCYACTVLYNPPLDVSVSQLEIFGPVICVYPYTDIEQAIANANALPFAFQGAVFTRDIDKAMYVSSRLAAAAVMINDHTAFRVDWMPFSGLRQSGLGTGGIPHTMDDMQLEKMIVIHSKGL